MDIRISAKNTTLTPTLENYIREKIEHMKNHFENIIRVEVQLEIFKNKHHGDDLNRAEIMVYAPKKTLRAECRASEMHEAFDLALPKIEKQIEKHKARLRRRDKGFLHRLGTVFSPLKRKKDVSGLDDESGSEGDNEE